MKLAVVVLSYNGLSDTLACLDSLHAQTPSPFASLDIIVVDNASSGDTVQEIRRHYPKLHMIELTENLGWAGGNNVGIRHAMRRGADFICLLNNDTTVPNNALFELLEASQLAGPCLMHPCIDYMERERGAQLDPEQRRMPRFRAFQHIFELDHAYGACLLIDRTVFEAVGLFDERFFLQLEETDFWMRARAKGFPSLCSTAARIFHAESASLDGRVSPFKMYYSVRNTLLLAYKHKQGFVTAAKKIYWTVHSQSKYGDPKSGSVPFYRWLWSDNLYIAAARAGVTDFVLGRFGKGRGFLFRGS